VAIGVSAIHYIISEGRQETTPESKPADQLLVAAPDSTISMQSDSPQSDHSLASLGFTTDRDVHGDIWESAYFEPEPAPLAWTESIRMKVYSYLNAKVLNISKGGFCIALPQDGVENIRTNELVAIRGKRGEWQLGEIRWLVCPTNAPMRAGIQKHSHDVQPAYLHVKSKSNQTQPLKCLVGNNETGSILFLPNLPFSLSEKNLSLELNGDKRRFKLTEQVYLAPAGSAYYFEWHKTQDPAASKAETTDNSYEAIWAKL